jgi:hypothetical protein
MADALRALLYVSWRTNLRRFVAPVPLVVLIAAIVGFVVLQTNVDLPDVQEQYLRYGVPAALGIAGIAGALRCPIRLRTADVAWVLPAPNGPRALVLYSLLTTFVGFGIIGLVGGGVRSGIGVGLIVTLLRTVFYLSYVLFTHGVPRIALVTAWVVLASGLAYVGLPNLGTAAVVTAVALAVTVALANRYHDAAARLAWEFAAVRSAVEQGAWENSAVTDATAQRPRRGISSLPAHPRFMGEAAFTWRAIAQLRRTWRSEALMILLVAVFATGLTLWAGPGLAMVPLAMATLVALGGSGSIGLAEELNRTFFRITSGRLGHLVLAVELVPFVTATATTIAAWLPAAILAENAGADFRVGGVLAAAGLAAVVVTSTSASAALARSMITRLSLTLLGTATSAVVAALIQTAITPGADGPGWIFGLVCVACASGLHAVTVPLVRRATIAPWR